MTYTKSKAKSSQTTIGQSLEQSLEQAEIFVLLTCDIAKARWCCNDVSTPAGACTFCLPLLFMKSFQFSCFCI